MSSHVAGWRASHVPGRWPVLMGPSSLVIVDPGTTGDLSLLWEKVIGSASMAELVTALAAIGPDQSPDLVALFWSSNGMRSLVRGNLRLLDPTTAEVVADGAGMLTWREVGLDDRDQIEIDLGAGPVGARGLPLVVGAVHAGAIRIEAGEAAAVISPQAVSHQAVSHHDVGHHEVGHDEVGHLEFSAADPVAAGAIWPPGGLTRRTSPPTVEEAVDRARFEMENGDTEFMAADFGPSAGSAGSAGSPDEADGGEAAGAAAEESADSARQAPLIQAAICQSGHPNPPAADLCGLCGAFVPPQLTQPVPRPALGVLRAPDGFSVPIDRPVLIGRAPVLRDDLAEIPELMRVPSPGQDISRTHLLVSPDDWEIRLTDLHSTNGTVVVRPGPDGGRLQLPPGEPHAVPVGTVIEMGDGVSVLVDGPSQP